MQILRNSQNLRTKITTALLYIFAIAVGLIFMLPVFWMLLSSFKFNEDVLTIPIHLFPPRWNFSSYASALQYSTYNFPRYIFNSLLVTVSAVLLSLLFSTTCGYGFAKYRFFGDNLFFTIILSTMMIPFQAIVIPLFVLIRRLGWQNSYIGLIVPESLLAFGVFMMRQFFYSVPKEIIESARIDGANEIRIFLRLAVPLSSTAILALTLFHFRYSWNLLLWPLICISSSKLRTLPLGISLFTGVYTTPYPEQLAVSVIACLPIVVLYIFLSKYFVQGIGTTGIKQ